MMNRQQRRAHFAQMRKSATVGIKDWKPVHGISGSLTQSNRSRPHVNYKSATGHVRNAATNLLARLGVGVYG